MPIELRLLAYSVALLLALILVQANASAGAQGFAVAVGNRDDLAPAKPFEGRARRALYNHIEGMALFAPLVLIAAQQNIHTAMTALGAQLFFYARLAHAGVYLIGLPYVRTAVWAVSIAGVILIFVALFGRG
jgi:uncharacterized MAPEG superfamily protein